MFGMQERKEGKILKIFRSKIPFWLSIPMIWAIIIHIGKEWTW